MTFPPDAPRLILLISVDQMRRDYLDRFGDLYSGGLRRLLDESVSFDQAYHEHALTVTAPGHATLSTGLYPRHHGIIDNRWFEADGSRVYCVDDEEHGSSPAKLEGSTLGDWLKSVSPASKVYGASGKDRSAILMAGRGADGAFWYDSDAGAFTSSGYYPGGEPEWLAELDLGARADAVFGQPWTPLESTAAVGVERAIEEIDEGLFAQRFPHLGGGLTLAPGEGFYYDLAVSPFLDTHLGDFARALIREEGLGADGIPDVLALSFSATDTVGHDFGPNSPEVLDTLLRLDATLGVLLDFLDAEIGLDRVLIALSADHGVVPVPEYQEAHQLPGRRANAQDALCWHRAGIQLAEAHDGRFPITPWRFVDRELIGGVEKVGSTTADPAQVSRQIEAVLAELRPLLEACPGVARVWTRGELEGDTEPADPMGRLFYRSFHPERSSDFLVQFEEGYLSYSGVRTTHGSPYPYDTHVPWLLRLPSGVAASIGDPVATVDIAPTLATLAGIPVPADRDGRERTAMLPEAVSTIH